MRIGSLCTGYGGLDLAVEQLYHAETVWHAQWDPDDTHQHAAQVLQHHYPDRPNHGDIRATDWTKVEPVDIITAGFPCQPVSDNGHHKGTADPRWLWPAVHHAVRLLRPGYVVLENVSALLRRGFTDVITDLDQSGYMGAWLCLRASDVGAPHRRERIFIVAHTPDAPRLRRRGGGASLSRAFHLDDLNERLRRLLKATTSLGATTPTAWIHGQPSSDARPRHP